jgi:hypothetical protein
MIGMTGRLFPTWRALASTGAGALIALLLLLTLVLASDLPKMSEEELVRAVLFYAVAGGALGLAAAQVTKEADPETRALLTIIPEASPRAAGNAAWLLPFRWQFRDVIRRCPRKTLTHLADTVPDPASRRLAIWLRGRCRGTFGTATIAKLRLGAEFPIRKEVTRALKRMEAWSILRNIEKCDFDPRIRRMARQAEAKPYDSRVTQFLRHVPQQPVSASRAPLYVHEGFDPQAGRPPKSPSLIRRILKHIRALVHGPSDRQV